MSSVPPARSIRVGAVASTVRPVTAPPEGTAASALPLARMNPATDCRRCGQPAVTEAICPRCGVIVAKARDRRAVPREPRPVRDAADADSAPSMPAWSLAVMALGLGMAALVGVRAWQKAHPPPPAATGAGEAAGPGRPAAVDVPPPSAAAPVVVPPEQLHVETAQASDADRSRADDLARRQANPASVSAADVQAAEDLLSRHSDERGFRNLLEAVLISAAARHQQQHQFSQAIAYLQRAQQVQPTSTRPSLALMELALQTGDWALAEAAARAAVVLDPRHFDAWYGLGYALMRQDRNREAIE